MIKVEGSVLQKHKQEEVETKAVKKCTQVKVNTLFHTTIGIIVTASLIFAIAVTKSILSGHVMTDSIILPLSIAASAASLIGLTYLLLYTLS